MRLLSPLLVLLAICPPSTSQDKKGPKEKPKAKEEVPAKVLAQLKPWQDRLKEATSPVVEQRAEAFVRWRNVATEVKVGGGESDFGDRDYLAHIVWVSTRQESKLFKDKEGAEKAKDWLPPGKVAGQDNGLTASQRFVATLYYSEGNWKLDKVEWYHITPKGAKPVPLPGASSQNGDKHPWVDALREVKPK